MPRLGTLAVVLVSAGTLLVALSPLAAAHWVKVDGCNGPDPNPVYVDANPLDNDLLGPDPSAVVVIHACVPCSDDPNLEPGGIKVLGCGTHG